ncbi:hypothetical protein GIB67_039868, partial [Kingdonia uniflora]
MSTLKRLVDGPSFKVTSYKTYRVNGFVFCTADSESSKTTQNSGVKMKAMTNFAASARDQNPREAETIYYGVVKEIIELDYYDFPQTVFYCDWVQVKDKVNGCTFDVEANLTFVNLEKLKRNSKRGRKINPFFWPNTIEVELKKPYNIGCGIWGPQSYVAKKYGAKGIGIDISPHNIQRGTKISNAQGLGHEVTFQVAEALQLPFYDGQFGTVWSLECGDHLPDKTKFVSELVRVTAPGGTIILATSCLGDLTPNEESLKPQERELLQSLCESIYLLEWISCAHYADLFKSHTMKVRKQLYIQGNSATHANLVVLDKLIAARHELAQ